MREMRIEEDAVNKGSEPSGAMEEIRVGNVVFSDPCLCCGSYKRQLSLPTYGPRKKVLLPQHQHSFSIPTPHAQPASPPSASCPPYDLTASYSSQTTPEKGDAGAFATTRPCPLGSFTASTPPASFTPPSTTTKTAMSRLGRSNSARIPSSAVPNTTTLFGNNSDVLSSHDLSGPAIPCWTRNEINAIKLNRMVHLLEESKNEIKEMLEETEN